MKYLLIIFIFLSALLAHAQQITVDLPHFAGKEYAWILFDGSKQDTIARSALDEKGGTVLTVPTEYKNWRGMSNLLLKDGGGLELILNGESDFTASCAVERPTINDIFYTGSEENTFLMEQYKKQQALMHKASVIASSAQAYKPDEPLYKSLAEEKDSLEKQFADLQRQTAESPLFAARIRQQADFCKGMGSRLDLTEEEFIAEQRKYIRDVVDFGQLWNSGMWNNLLFKWMSNEANQSDSVIVADAKVMLARVSDRETRLRLLKKMVSLFSQYEKENLFMQMGAETLQAAAMLSPGDKAPALLFSDSTRSVPINSLLFFYESGCPGCETEMVHLRDKYRVLQAKNIRVISIAADADETTYKKNADSFPWKQKLCDFKGFEGVNFVNYSVVATPTIYVIDGKGVVTGRYAKLEEFLKE